VVADGAVLSQNSPVIGAEQLATICFLREISQRKTSEEWMKHRFWNNRWERGEIGFHQAEITPFLSRFFPSLGLAKNARVLVPLCGKSLDLLWMREQEYQVVGVELSEQAVSAFFAENGIEPHIEPHGPFLSYSVENLQLFAVIFLN
jgi:thiopurine S-methyltransferase